MPDAEELPMITIMGVVEAKGYSSLPQIMQ
jgi:hypothetical protein